MTLPAKLTEAAAAIEQADREMTPGPWDNDLGAGFVTNHDYDVGSFESNIDAVHAVALRNLAPDVAALLRQAAERIELLERDPSEARFEAEGLRADRNRLRNAIQVARISVDALHARMDGERDVPRELTWRAEKIVEDIDAVLTAATKEPTHG